MGRHWLFLTGSVLVYFLASTASLSTLEAQRKPSAGRQEEAADYFAKWLNQDVVYIITAEERAIFESLGTEEEKEEFIEQFWFRRDPDPRTPTNEFKDEHYRRIAYVNERYFSAYEGWQTDRGRIYIIHGPPTEIEAYAGGGQYHRPAHEGGGSTATFPFEIWRYQFIEGLGSDIEIEFVDSSMTGEYRIAREAEEKDALLWLPGHGLTKDEQWGFAEKRDRTVFSPGTWANEPFMSRRIRDNPFERYARINFMQRPPDIKYRDLKELVDVRISFDNPVDFATRQDYYLLNDNQFLAPLTISIRNSELTFTEESGRHRAQVAIYGLVTSISNRILTEFEHELSVQFSSEELGRGLQGASGFQKILTLERRGRYRIDLVVRDLQSGRTGILQQAMIPPTIEPDTLTATRLVLAESIRVVDDSRPGDEMFMVGDVQVRPSLERAFSGPGSLGVYFQLYNVGFDQAKLAPDLSLMYTVKQDGKPIMQQEDSEGGTVQYLSRQRVVLLNSVPLDFLPSGTYELEVKVADRIRGQELLLKEGFQVVAAAPDGDR